MIFFLRSVSQTNWTKLSSDLIGYGFIQSNHFFYNQPLTINQLARGINQDPKILIQHFPSVKKNLNQSLSIEKMGEYLLAQNLDFIFLKNWTLVDSYHHYLTTAPEFKIINRAPVIAIMGHVDHGKTTLLDGLRSSNVAAQEKGSITQKIGSYTLEINQQKLTFLDTPGHEFFQTMRQQGAEIADLGILVVSGTEGVKPQTVEAIKHLQNAKLPVIVFVNKNDHPDYNFEQIQNQLTKYNLTPKEWGGTTLFVKGSALKKTGFPELFEALTLITKKINLLVPVETAAQAIVIDWVTTPGGPETILLITHGTLQLRDFFWTKTVSGRLRSLRNNQKKTINFVLAGTIAIVTGIGATVIPGQKIYFFPNGSLINKFPKPEPWSKNNSFKKPFFEDINQQKTNLIIKFSGKGFERALQMQIPQLEQSYQKINFLTVSAGELNQADLYNAINSRAVIITFNLSIKNEFLRQINQYKLQHFSSDLLHEIWNYIYRLANQSPVTSETIVSGKFEILKIFVHSKFKQIAGGVVRFGKIIHNNQEIRIIRNEKIIIDKLKIHSLRNERNFINEAITGVECGIIFLNYHDFKIGDIFEQYIEKKTHHEI